MTVEAGGLRLDTYGQMDVRLYRNHLPLAWGQLEPGQGRMWLAVAVAAGWEGQGHGSTVVGALQGLAREGGFAIWLTCRKDLAGWYARLGFRPDAWRPDPPPAKGSVVMRWIPKETVNLLKEPR